ncbi:MAG: nucleotidyl transferase AbiEii/AbiGii toxin family protein [Bacilli bacterium]|jgi:hypothetical protein
MKLLNEDQIKSGRSFNQYKIGYKNLYKNDNTMLPFIILETMLFYNPYPYTTLKTSNYITIFLFSENETEIINRFNLNPFNMCVQTIERTFVNKLFAICDYYLKDDYNRKSRHIYDVHMMWESKLLDLNIVKNIIPNVIKDRQRHENINLSCNKGAKPVEILNEIVSKKVFVDDYNAITVKLLYKKVDYSVAIKTIQAIINSKILPEEIF